jgi:hypothetical protein
MDWTKVFSLHWFTVNGVFLGNPRFFLWRILDLDLGRPGSTSFVQVPARCKDRRWTVHGGNLL